MHKSCEPFWLESANGHFISVTNQFLTGLFIWKYLKQEKYLFIIKEVDTI